MGRSCLSYSSELHITSEIKQRIFIKFGTSVGAHDSQNLGVLCEVSFQLHHHFAVLVGLRHSDDIAFTVTSNCSLSLL